VRVKLVTELQAGETTEVEVARIERDEQTGLSDLGLRLAEAKQLTSALQAEIVPAQVTIAGEHRCTCAAFGRVLAARDITPRYFARCSVTFTETVSNLGVCRPFVRAGWPGGAQGKRVDHGRDDLPALFSPQVLDDLGRSHATKMSRS
jgi:hypothetical protein